MFELSDMLMAVRMLTDGVAGCIWAGSVQTVWSMHCYMVDMCHISGNPFNGIVDI